MKIYTVCIDQQSGRYMAVSNEDPTMLEVSYMSEAEAAGLLVSANPGISVEAVVSLETKR